MKLTSVLFKYRPEFVGYVPKFPGSAYTGKHRFVPPVTGFAKYFVMRRILQEENNMRLLDSPYISKEQEQAYLQSVGRTHPEYYDEFMFKTIVKADKQFYAADMLEGLDRSRSLEIRE